MSCSNYIEQYLSLFVIHMLHNIVYADAMMMMMMMMMMVMDVVVHHQQQHNTSCNDRVRTDFTVITVITVERCRSTCLLSEEVRTHNSTSP